MIERKAFQWPSTEFTVVTCDNSECECVHRYQSDVSLNVSHEATDLRAHLAEWGWIEIGSLDLCPNCAPGWTVPDA